jgi:hypothetical protein
MHLSIDQRRVLLAIATGSALKSQRYLDGTKLYQLHALDGSAATVSRATVNALERHGLIDSNKKFPAATYWLTETGQQIATDLGPVRHGS